MTYREAIQKLQQDAETINRKINSIRDESYLNAKPHLNKLRGLFMEVWDTFSAIDNQLTDAQAAEEVEGKY